MIASSATDCRYIVKIGLVDVLLEIDFDPLNDPEKYMNIKQLAYFKRRLLLWKDDLKHKIKITVDHISGDTSMRHVSEEGDIASDDAELFNELRTRDRYRKLIAKIDHALTRIETGCYGYCEKSGDEIGLKRLIARPIATLSIAVQEMHENEEDIRDDAEYTHNMMTSEDQS